MSSLTPSRRTVLRTAAWSVPAVTVATAAPAFASSPNPNDPPTYQTVTQAFTYEARLGGPTGTPLGDIGVEVTAIVPLTAPRGSELNPTETTSTVTIPGNLANLLKQVYLPGATEIDGTSVSTSILTGALSDTTVANLTIPRTPLPGQDQPMITTATGASESGLLVPADATPGLVTITMGEPNSKLTGYNADGPTGGVYDSVLYKKDGVDYTLATFNVV